MAVVAAGSVVCALLAGCASVDPRPIPTSVSSSNAVFQSTDDARSAARDTYTKYAVASDAAAEAGGVGIEGISPYVTVDEMEAEQSAADFLNEKKWRIVGRSKLLKFEVQNADLNTGKVSAYVCVDVSTSRVIDNAGKDVTPASRKDRQTSVAEFVWRGDRLLLNRTSAWSGDPIC